MKHVNENKDAEEIARALKLAIAQIDMSMRESDESVKKLISSIINMTGVLRQIKHSLEAHGDETVCEGYKEIRKQTNIAEQSMHEAVTAFQFYDRLSQRFSHIEENLQSVAELVVKPDEVHAELWQRLEKKMRSVYSTEQEQTLYLALLHGISKDEIEQQPVLATTSHKSGEVELF